MSRQGDQGDGPVPSASRTSSTRERSRQQPLARGLHSTTGFMLGSAGRLRPPSGLQTKQEAVWRHCHDARRRTHSFLVLRPNVIALQQRSKRDESKTLHQTLAYTRPLPRAERYEMRRFHQRTATVLGHKSVNKNTKNAINRLTTLIENVWKKQALRCVLFMDLSEVFDYVQLTFPTCLGIIIVEKQVIMK